MDLTEAEVWWRRAAELVDARAAFYLGTLLNERGETAEAEPWLRQAAEGNDPDGVGQPRCPAP